MVKLVVFDMDGVLADIESSWVFVHKKFGVNNDHSLYAYLRGEITDLEFIRRDIDLWRKKKPSVSREDIALILEEVPLMPGAEEAVSILRSKGVKTAIVSAGVDLLAERIAKQLGMDMQMANGMEADGAGRLTGEGVLKVRLTDKGEALVETANALGIPLEETASVGNSRYDVSMFRRSAKGIAFMPEDQEVRKEADVVVEQKDLRAVVEHL